MNRAVFLVPLVCTLIYTALLASTGEYLIAAMTLFGCALGFLLGMLFYHTSFQNKKKKKAIAHLKKEQPSPKQPHAYGLCDCGKPIRQKDEFRCFKCWDADTKEAFES